jgi:hypothetical protein
VVGAHLPDRVARNETIRGFGVSHDANRPQSPTCRRHLFLSQRPNPKTPNLSSHMAHTPKFITPTVWSVSAQLGFAGDSPTRTVRAPVRHQLERFVLY